MVTTIFVGIGVEFDLGGGGGSGGAATPSSAGSESGIRNQTLQLNQTLQRVSSFKRAGERTSVVQSKKSGGPPQGGAADGDQGAPTRLPGRAIVKQKATAVATMILLLLKLASCEKKEGGVHSGRVAAPVLQLEGYRALPIMTELGPGQDKATLAATAEEYEPTLARKELVPQELEDRRLSTTYTSSSGSDFDGWASSTFLQDASGKSY